MRPTEAEALKQAMAEELDESTYNDVIELAEEIRFHAGRHA
jgi:hypothetical protein